MAENPIQIVFDKGSGALAASVTTSANGSDERIV